MPGALTDTGRSISSGLRRWNSDLNVFNETYYISQCNGHEFKYKISVLLLPSLKDETQGGQGRTTVIKCICRVFWTICRKRARLKKAPRHPCTPSHWPLEYLTSALPPNSAFSLEYFVITLNYLDTDIINPRQYISNRLSQYFNIYHTECTFNFFFSAEGIFLLKIHEILLLRSLRYFFCSIENSMAWKYLDA